MRALLIFFSLLTVAHPLHADENCKRASLQLVRLLKLPPVQRDRLLSWAEEFDPSAPDETIHRTLELLLRPTAGSFVADVYPFLVEQLQNLKPERPEKSVKLILQMMPLRMASLANQKELTDRMIEWVGGLIVHRPSLISELAAGIEDDALRPAAVVQWNLLLDAIAWALSSPGIKSQIVDEILWELSVIRRDMFSHYQFRVTAATLSLISAVSALKKEVGSYVYVAADNPAEGVSGLYWVSTTLDEIDEMAQLRELEPEHLKTLQLLKNRSKFISNRDDARMRLNARIAEFFDRFSPMPEDALLGSFRNHASLYNVLDKDRLEASIGRIQLDRLVPYINNPDEILNSESLRDQVLQGLLKQVDYNRMTWGRLGKWRRRLETLPHRVALAEAVETVELWTKDLEKILSDFLIIFRDRNSDITEILSTAIHSLTSGDRAELLREAAVFSPDSTNYQKSLSRYEWMRAAENLGFDFSEIPEEWRHARAEDLEYLAGKFKDPDLAVPNQQVIQLEIEMRLISFQQEPSTEKRQELWKLANFLQKRFEDITLRMRHQVMQDDEYFVYAKRSYRLYTLQKFFISQINLLPGEVREPLRVLLMSFRRWNMAELDFLLFHGSPSLDDLNERRAQLTRAKALGLNLKDFPMEFLEFLGASSNNTDISFETLKNE